ncbi:MAG TPA: peroxiredoxin [Candidatus Binatia bacterium]|jgi:peroxiredoxin (alkyl hydroperoxide reductase subunit C)|nr:peroxiredoxin [Candidatus Binatia bacterium]
MAAHVQQPAPDFKAQAVVSGAFQTVSLADYKGKYLVLFFYPLDFTFVCPTEILAYNDRADEFRKLGAEIVGASVDSEYSHLAWINTPRKEGGISGVTIPLLADLNKKIAADYGVLLPDGVALRGTFVIDPKGILRTITIHDLPVGRSVDEALRQVQAIKFADEHGEVCPANWEPGKDSMKADPKGSKEYFKKVG